MRLGIVSMGLTLLALGACTGARPAHDDQDNAGNDVGRIQLAIASAPAGASCLRITVAAGTGSIVRTFPLTQGTATTGTLSGLPLGSVSVRAEAFGVTCANIGANTLATWASLPVNLVLVSGTPAQLTLVMQPAGQINVTVDWNPDGGIGAGGGGSGGAATGGAGTGGAAGAGGAGGGIPVDPSVATALDGQRWLVPCGRNEAYSDLVCENTTPAGGCPQNTNYLISGMVNRDDTVTFGGDPGTTYNVTVRVRGIIEPKHYTGCTTYYGTAREGFASGPTGTGTGGGGQCFPSTSGNYNVYMLGVSNPARSYYFNAINKAEAHVTYPIDYTVTIPIVGGATLRILASDSNCATMRNCDPTSVDAPGGMGNCVPNILANFNEPGIVQPYNGQFVVVRVVSVSR